MISRPFAILILAIMVYLIWAIIYHRHDKSLTFTILMEYVLTAILAVILLMGVII